MARSRRRRDEAPQQCLREAPASSAADRPVGIGGRDPPRDRPPARERRDRRRAEADDGQTPAAHRRRPPPEPWYRIRWRRVASLGRPPASAWSASRPAYPVRPARRDASDTCRAAATVDLQPARAYPRSTHPCANPRTPRRPTMPELRIKEVRLPELHLPEMSRDDITRAIGDATRDIELRRCRVDLPEVAADISRELSKIDVPQAVAMRRSRPARACRSCIGALILGLMAIAVATSPPSGPSSSRPPAKRSVASTRCGPSARSGTRRRTRSIARSPSRSSRRRSPRCADDGLPVRWLQRAA